MMSLTEPPTTDELAADVGDNVTITGSPQPGNRVEIDYSPSSGGAYQSRGKTISGELLYISEFGTDSAMYVIRDNDSGRTVNFIPSHRTIRLKSGAARNTRRGTKLGEIKAIRFTDEDVSEVAPAIAAIAECEPGDTIHVHGTEYGITETTAAGPDHCPDNFTIYLANRDIADYRLKVNAGYSTTKITFGPWDDREDISADAIQPGRRADLKFRENGEDTTDVFPAPHGAREGERLAFTYTDRDDDTEEQMTGTVTSVRYYTRLESQVLGTPDYEPPETHVELDDGRTAKITERDKSRAMVIQNPDADALDEKYRHGTASNFHQPTDADDEDASTDGGQLLADGGVESEDSPKHERISEGDTLRVEYSSNRVADGQTLTRKGVVQSVTRWEDTGGVDTVELVTPDHHCRVLFAADGPATIEQKANQWTTLGEVESYTIRKALTDGGMVGPGKRPPTDVGDAVMSVPVSIGGSKRSPRFKLHLMDVMFHEPNPPANLSRRAERVGRYADAMRTAIEASDRRADHTKMRNTDGVVAWIHVDSEDRRHTPTDVVRVDWTVDPDGITKQTPAASPVYYRVKYTKPDGDMGAALITDKPTLDWFTDTYPHGIRSVEPVEGGSGDANPGGTALTDGGVDTEGGHDYDTKTVRVHLPDRGMYVYLMLTRFNGEGGILAREGWKGTYVWYSVISRNEQACVSGADPWALSRRYPGDWFPDSAASALMKDIDMDTIQWTDIADGQHLTPEDVDALAGRSESDG